VSDTLPPAGEENPKVNLPEGKPKRKMAVLDQILQSTRATLPALRTRAVDLGRAAAARPVPPSFRHALRGRSVGLIAEVKRRSPSAGAINEQLDPSTLAGHYVAGGAVAISVLTERAHFGGTIEDLEAVVATVGVPVLRKDFIVDELQLVEARAVGASAVLLIVRALSQPELRQLLLAAAALDLATLVEAHDREELDRALEAGADVIGINARNLDDFSIDIGMSLELLSSIPADCIAVAESGMSSLAHVARAAAAGADAVLIGGALAASANPTTRASEFSGVSRRGR
jgi:indole-3-glycerol phosphate synthase